MSNVSKARMGIRIDFCLEKLRLGHSFREVEKLAARQYKVTDRAARGYVDAACERIQVAQTPTHRQKVYKTIVEIFHAQIVHYQNDLAAIQQNIDDMDNLSKRREELLDLIGSSNEDQNEDQRELYKLELGSLPRSSPYARGTLVEGKSRIRQRLIQAVHDLAKLQGIPSHTDWRAALNTLLDNGLLPSLVAERILAAMDQFEMQVRASGESDGFDSPS